MFCNLWQLSYNILKSVSVSQLSGITAVVFGISIIIGIILLIVFMKNCSKNIRSMKTVNYMSLGVFFILLSFAALVSERSVYDNNFVSMCNTVVMMLYIPLTIFLLVLLVGNLILILKSGYSKKNTVSILVVVIAILFEHLLYEVALADDNMISIILSELIGGLCLYFMSIFIGSFISTFIFLIIPPKYDKDFIIVLGCKCTADGKVSKLLKARLNSAFKFYGKQLSRTGKKAKFIVTGGQSTKGCDSEALIMSKYLISLGVNKKDIIIEDKAKNTFQNMKFSKDIIDNIDEKAKSVFVTNDFHIFRSGIFADINKLHSIGLSSKSNSWYYSLSYFIMECKGVFDTYKKYHVYICSAIAITSIFIALIYNFNMKDIMLQYYT